MTSVLFAIALTFAAKTSGFPAKVVAITDGDTIKVLHNGEPERVRLNGIDCPEKKQPFGTKAKQFTADLAFGQEVTVRPFGKDRYGRTIADIILPDGRILNHELLKAGLAWWYRKYAPADVELERLEARARAAKVGLWRDTDPAAPWEYRRRDRIRNTSQNPRRTGPNEAEIDKLPSDAVVFQALRILARS